MKSLIITNTIPNKITRSYTHLYYTYKVGCDDITVYVSHFQYLIYKPPMTLKYLKQKTQ
jgi:hypothetical protein